MHLTTSHSRAPAVILGANQLQPIARTQILKFSAQQAEILISHVRLWPDLQRKLSVPGDGMKSVAMSHRDLERLANLIAKTLETGPTYRVRQQLMAARTRCIKRFGLGQS